MLDASRYVITGNIIVDTSVRGRCFAVEIKFGSQIALGKEHPSFSHQNSVIKRLGIRPNLT